jgi:hypothetical protein
MAQIKAKTEILVIKISFSKDCNISQNNIGSLNPFESEINELKTLLC